MSRASTSFIDPQMETVSSGKDVDGRDDARPRRESSGATVGGALPRLQDASISREWFPIALPASCPGEAKRCCAPMSRPSTSFIDPQMETSRLARTWMAGTMPGRDGESAGATVAGVTPPARQHVREAGNQPNKKAALEAPLSG